MATSDEELTVWVGGLEPEVTTEILWELFIQAGPLLDVKLPVDRETGEHRNFAFIAFKHPISGPYAERLFNGTQLFGKVIRVRYKGTQKFDQNQYHDLYEKLLEKLVVDNPDKYAGIFEQIDEVKANFIGNRIVYDEDEQFAGYNSQPSNNPHRQHPDNSYQGNTQRPRGNFRGNQHRTDSYHSNAQRDASGYGRRQGGFEENQRSQHSRNQDGPQNRRNQDGPQNKSQHRRSDDDSFYRQRGSRF